MAKGPIAGFSGWSATKQTVLPLLTLGESEGEGNRKKANKKQTEKKQTPETEHRKGQPVFLIRGPSKHQ